MNFDNEKQLVLSHYEQIASAKSSNILQILQKRTSSEWRWFGYSPCNEQVGAEAVAETFWKPYLNDVSSVQRRQDIFFAGTNQMDGFQSTWVVSMGHLVGLFDKPLWGIQSTKKMSFLRYCEFNKVIDNKIVETAFFLIFLI